MTDERRYGEDEVREIFEAASTERDGRPGERGTGTGLTLREIQSIGREVGLSPTRIADAAAALEHRRETRPARTFLGVPVSVARTVALPRQPTDREWELVLADLRETFRARGHVESHGTTRQWSNGNLYARVEPTGSGYRLSLGSFKESAVAMARGGGFLLALGAVLVVVALLTTGPSSGALDAPLVLGLLGGGMLGSSALRLRSWAGTRQAQMEDVAERARALIDEPS